MHLGVDAPDRTCEQESLVGQVASEVKQGATTGRWRAGLRLEPLETRLEAGQRPK
jgi:hypothetical protein